MEINKEDMNEGARCKEKASMMPFLERKEWCMNEGLYNFQGFWLTQTYVESTKRVLQHFKPHPNDVILASFPKTGTTWLKALLYSITHYSSNMESLMLTHPQELIRALETYIYLHQPNIGEDFNHMENKDDAKEGRIVSTHLPYQILGDTLESSGCKIVYVTRNPKDALISLWHFLQKSEAFEEDPWELEVAVDQFCKGVIPFGPYYDHVLAYRQESLRRTEKVFFVTFEELKEDPKTQVVRMAEFLGCPLGQESEHQADEIVKMCSFETLSSLEVNKSNDAPDGFPLPYSSFFRKGEVGDYRNYLGDDLVEKIDGVTRDKFHGVGFEYGI